MTLLLVATLISFLIYICGEAAGASNLSWVGVVLPFLLMVFEFGVSTYIENHAKREISTEKHQIVKIGNAYYKEHAPWKRLVLYKDYETGEIESLLCNEEEFEIKNGNEEQFIVQMAEPVYPSWLNHFTLYPVRSEFHFTVIIPEDTSNERG